jgi:hypothetical protein
VTDHDRVEFDPIAHACAVNLRQGLALCPASPIDRHRVCQMVCADAVEMATVPLYGAAHEIGARAPPQAAPSSVPSVRPLASVSPPATRPPDSFQRALRACIINVVESGGEAVCHFERPLDEMDFGQKHCNDRCARAVVSKPPNEAR